MKVIVIIPAAGLGTRMVGAAKDAAKPALSKQFAELGGVPIIIRTLRRFAELPEIDEIYVALRRTEQDQFRPRLEQEKLAKPVRLVDGGEHRQESVGNALRAVNASDDDIVLVHDAVRPLVDREIILNVIEQVKKTGAAIAGVPAVDTIKQVERTAEGAVITTTVPRERAVLAQTPQGFKFSIIKKAFDEALNDGFTGTDEASLIERMGGDVSVVMGSPKNLKITTPGDLELAEFYIQNKK